MPNRKKVAIIMGSDSDWPVVKSACGVLKDFDVPFEAHILSAHRTPEAAAAFAKSARANGYGVILCAAGMAAHLAGAFAANTTLPVVGIPMKGGAMDGLDALLATVQMPSGFRHCRKKKKKGCRHRCRSRSYVTSNPGLFAVVLSLFIKRIP